MNHFHPRGVEHCRLAAFNDIFAETDRNHDADKNFILVDGALDRSVGIREAADIEILGALELAGHLAACGSAVLIVYQSRNMIDIQS